MPTRSRTGTAGASNTEGAALDEDIREIRNWERATLASRTRAERFSDWISATIASGPSIAAHLVWFVGWIAINAGVFPRLVFDPFPFSFLTMVVSLEAIFLALFVLASQNRLSRQSDQRSHLDLQINLLAEREMTAVLQLLDDIAVHLDVETSVKASEVRDLAQKTDLHGLTRRMDELVVTEAEPPARPRGRRKKSQ